MGVSVIPIKVPALQAGQEYTQDKRDRFNVSLPVDKVRGLTWGDKAATLYVEESDNGSTWVATKTTAIVAKTTADTGWVTLSKRYYRFRIKNGTATQGSITLYQQIVGMGSYLDMEEQAGIVVLDHGIPAANPVPTQLTGSFVAYDGTHDALRTVNASLLHESFDFKETPEVTVSPGSYLGDTYRPTNGYAQARIIAKRIDANHDWRLYANWSSVNGSAYQVVEELHTASLTDANTRMAKIVTPVGSQWVSMQLFNDDAENSQDYHVHMMLTAG